AGLAVPPSDATANQRQPGRDLRAVAATAATSRLAATRRGPQIRRAPLRVAAQRGIELHHFHRRPTPNWSPFRTGTPSRNTTSTIFSLWTWRPCSSRRAVTSSLVFTSNTSPVDG